MSQYARKARLRYQHSQIVENVVLVVLVGHGVVLKKSFLEGISETREEQARKSRVAISGAGLSGDLEGREVIEGRVCRRSEEMRAEQWAGALASGLAWQARRIHARALRHTQYSHVV